MLCTTTRQQHEFLGLLQQHGFLLLLLECCPSSKLHYYLRLKKTSLALWEAQVEIGSSDPLIVVTNTSRALCLVLICLLFSVTSYWPSSLSFFSRVMFWQHCLSESSHVRCTALGAYTLLLQWSTHYDCRRRCTSRRHAWFCFYF